MVVDVVLVYVVLKVLGGSLLSLTLTWTITMVRGGREGGRGCKKGREARE